MVLLSSESALPSPESQRFSVCAPERSAAPPADCASISCEPFPCAVQAVLLGHPLPPAARAPVLPLETQREVCGKSCSPCGPPPNPGCPGPAPQGWVSAHGMSLHPSTGVCRRDSETGGGDLCRTEPRVLKRRAELGRTPRHASVALCAPSGSLGRPGPSWVTGPCDPRTVQNESREGAFPVPCRALTSMITWRVHEEPPHPIVYLKGVGIHEKGAL